MLKLDFMPTEVDFDCSNNYNLNDNDNDDNHINEKDGYLYQTE